jgi:hypothetical protein
MWRPIGSSSGADDAPPASVSPTREAPSNGGPSERASGALVLALTALWTYFVLTPLLLLPFLQPPPWPLSATRAPLAAAASLVFAYLFWLLWALFRAGNGDDRDG